ncbi:MAG: FprA family A-type flavoprotein [Deltaproteobacteria bacterium]|nr:MAG: FprA family A-type flavoprotein [Deltaproteobacteria bacterium]
MPNTMLFEQGEHRNVLLEDFGHGLAVQANQHVIIHNGEGMILDPGGHKVYTKVLSETTHLLGRSKLKYLFLSHQDPDIIAAANGWLMTTDASAYISKLWVRFVPHFGLDRLVEERLLPIPDEGMVMNLAGLELLVLPAHFLHSCGNFHVYDPVSKILYTGDLGASLGMDYIYVSDFEQHLQYMDGFHRRYMACNAALRPWVKMVRQLDIEIIAPQHGAMFQGKEMVGKFLDYMENLQCGADIMQDIFQIPGRV